MITCVQTAACVRMASARYSVAMVIWLIVCPHASAAHPLPRFSQTIARFGQWNQDVMYKSYLAFFKPEGLLLLGGWTQPGKVDFTSYFAERFMVQVPQVSLYKPPCRLHVATFQAMWR